MLLRQTPFPFVVIEALSCGLPVIATDVGGVAEQVQNGLTGKLVPMGDARAMAKEIVNLSLDGRQRKMMSRRAAAHSKAYYGEKKMLKSYMSFYYAALQNAA